MTQSTTLSSFQHLAAELRLYCGEDSLKALAKELQRSGCRRAVVVSGRSVQSSAAMDELRAAIGPALVGESITVRPNSPVAAVEVTARALAEMRADAVIAVGGGSAAVTARAASILLAEQRPVQELCTRRLANGQFESPRLGAAKIVQFVVPTTPSTAFVKAGSAVHDEASGQRLALFDPKTRAKALFVHPAFLRTAPAGLVQEAALNTLSTTIEALESPRCDPFSEAMLTHALRLVARHLAQVSVQDEAARQALVMAAMLCGRGTEQAGGGLASVLAHAIGHRVHVSNGTVNAIVLPQTMRFNAPVTTHTTSRIAQALSGSNSPGVTAVDALGALLATLDTPRRLRDIGLTRTELEPIAQAAMSDWFISRSARPITQASEISAILEAAW